MNNQSGPGRLRIVAGKWRSRLLHIADLPDLRPTPARVRETVFNWLGPGVHGARCLDLFAGTGALGLEALSRGAREAVFVEQSGKAAAALAKNIETVGAAAAATVHRGDAFEWLRRYSGAPFDIVFLDPPFADASLGDLCRLLDEKHIVTDDGRVYVEDDRGREATELPSGWHYEKSKQAGNVRYSLVRIGGAPQ